ncbi:MAG: C25 family cysteine peptidase [Bacteroidales bacterium]
MNGIFSRPSFGSLRTRQHRIGDDEDGNLHMEQADSLSRFIPDNYNQKKIYLDAYPQISTPAGERYPDVTSEINNQIEEGVLILNYVGHGGKSGWAHERILQTSDIQGWKNKDKLPVFITATCESSRFDEPELNTVVKWFS